MKLHGAAVLAALVAPMKGNAFSNTPISHGTMATNLPMYTNHQSNYPISQQKRRLAFIRLFSTANDNDTGITPPLPDTSDPFRILNLNPTADKREIKRAYKRMALKYHPDVRTNSKSTESQRRQSNDDFSRINAAYAFLTGKSEDKPDATESEKKRGASKGGRTNSSYEPPHRRTASDQASYSNDWKDYMPKYDEKEYDAGGDSFGSIFSDLFSEIGSSDSKGSRTSILNDFISFLEGNFPSVGTKEQKEEDIILNSLLKDGSKKEIKEEFDDAKLLVKQLEQKEFDLEVELKAAIMEKESTGSKTYMDGMRLEGNTRELEARKDVVGDYLDRARMRQLKLRKRLEELKTDSGRYDNRSSSTNENFARGSTAGTAAGNYSSTSSSGGTSSQEKADDENAWKRESFGSGRRRRGSGRSRASQTSQSNSSSSSTGSSASESTSQSTSSSPFSSGAQGANSGVNSDRRSSTYASSSSAPSSKRSSGTYSQDSSSQSNVPPHRRLTSRYERVQDDKRRLSEIKVDEEIDKMKKELGL